MDNEPKLDPDRYFDLKTPGAHEWWYFDAISADGRDVLVIIFYAGLPFDPSYGVAAIRHVRNPDKYPRPNPLDHSAVGLSWHRDGKQVAYALSGHKASAFRHQADPFTVEVATSRLVRDADGSYRLTVLTPSVDGKPIRASIRFTPAAGTEPFERNLGSEESPHHWILAAPDCQVEGSVAIGDQSMNFQGRGYHDHNAGSEEMSLAMRRWEWGRVHIGDQTEVYYSSTPQPGKGDSQSLWITWREGRPDEVRIGQSSVLLREKDPERTIFGVKHSQERRLDDGHWTLTRRTAHCLDDGPFYRRWIADFESQTHQGLDFGSGIAELLDTRQLNRWYVNWMIPYRLKWPRP